MKFPSCASGWNITAAGQNPCHFAQLLRLTPKQRTNLKTASPAASPMPAMLTKSRRGLNRLRGQGSGPVRKHCNSIPVRKANGERLIGYELWGEPWLFGLIADYRLELSTGEAI